MDRTGSLERQLRTNQKLQSRNPVRVGFVARGERFGGGLRFDEFAAAQPEVVAILVRCLVDAFQNIHRGFQLREILNEALGSTEKDWGLAGGNWSVRDDYSKYYLRA